jgi:hypothetical protein
MAIFTQFSDFLPDVLAVQPTQMMALAKRLGQDGQHLGKVGVATSFPPKSIDQILDCIEQGDTAQISLLEWLLLLQHKEVWDQHHQSKAAQSAQRIWQAAGAIPLLKHRLLWRSALMADGNANSLAHSLYNEFRSHVDRYLVGEALLCQQTLTALLRANSGVALAEIMLQHRIMPDQLAKKAGLPPKLKKITEARAYLPEAFVALYLNPISQRATTPSTAIAERYLLKEMLSQPRDIAIKFAEKLLVKIPYDQAINFSALYQGILERCAPKVKNTLWEELSAKAQEALCHWLSVAHYRDFESIVELLISDKHKLISNDDERKRLKSRSAFWSDYQTRFLNIQICLSQTTHDAIKRNLKKLRTDQISILKHDNRDTSEICIFELESCYIAEVFRGGSGETRYIPKTEQTQRVLSQSTISLNDLRAIEISEAHDHVYLWQHYAEKWLHHKKIYRDKNAKRQFNERAPSKEKQHQRNAALKTWRDIMDRLEAEARGINPSRIGSSKSKETTQKPPTAKTRPSVVKLTGSRFQDHGDGTVIDTTTGLQWMRYCLGQHWNGMTCEGKAATYTWREALKRAKQVTFAGYNDWRLPTIDELKSIIEKNEIPTINSKAFPNTSTQSHVWSSSSNANHSSYVWYVYFDYGYAGYGDCDNHGHVRLVRGGQ